MSDVFASFIYVAAVLAVFFGTLPLVVAILRKDDRRIDRILDRYEMCFVKTIDALTNILKRAGRWLD
jgi:hypothetical protein